MGVYIKGMEMPKKQVCVILNPNGLVEVLDANNVLLKEYQAIPVPPHGRLIDADALREGWLENGENEYVYDTNAFLDSLDDSPTIIPASGGAEDE